MKDRSPRTRWDRAALIALPSYWLLLFVATHYPRVRIPGEVPHGDKLLHFTAFGVLALLYWRFARVRGPLGEYFLWTSGAVLIAYAAIDEYLQQFFGRFTDWTDFAANTAGIVTVLVALALRTRRHATRTTRT